MDLTPLLDRIRAAGVQLRARAGKLEFRGNLTPSKPPGCGSTKPNSSSSSAQRRSINRSPGPKCPT
jgi:hypothetical protein